jgi:hypothetical protein
MDLSGPGIDVKLKERKKDVTNYACTSRIMQNQQMSKT